MKLGTKLVGSCSSVAGSVLPNRVKRHIQPKYDEFYKRFLLHHDPNRLARRDKINIIPCGICNLKCRFCAYQYKEKDEEIMTNDMFFSIVEESVSLGYRIINLTPVTGEIFIDPAIQEKMGFMDNHPRVESYRITTNLTAANRDDLRATLNKEKIGRFRISIYGHDEESFRNVSRGSQHNYNRLLDNLEFLAERVKDTDVLDLEIRTYGSIDCLDILEQDEKKIESDILTSVKRLRREGANVTDTPSYEEYDNWGGLVDEDDVEGLDINLRDDPDDNCGACKWIFRTFSIYPDGEVTVCQCFDVNAELTIGDVTEEDLKEILDINKNNKIQRIIGKHRSGDLPNLCDGCTRYEPI